MSENHFFQKIYVVIWILVIILVGTFIGTIYNADWYEYQDPWLASEKLPISEEYQVQLPVSNLEYVLWIVVLDNVSLDSQAAIETSYIAGSIQVFFNNETEAVETGSGVARDIGDELPLYAPAAIRLVFHFTNPSDPLNIRINVIDASASTQPIWWVRIFRNDHPEVLFIQGFSLGGGFVVFVGLVVYFFLFLGKK